MSSGGDPLIGQTFSHYRIVEKLGVGGMGVVYKAEDTRLHRPVALKFISEGLAADAEALGRFQREARTASALNHPHICTIYDIGEQGGRSFIAMEYLEGQTLKDRLAAGPLRRDAVLRLGTQLADALDAAHRAGVIHRDIKPANLFIGSRDHLKVLDFGVAKMRTQPHHAVDATTVVGTRQGVVVGTAAYMSPEQAGGEVVDHRADIWSAGMVLYEMISGTRPSSAGRRSLGDSELEPIIAKCLDEDRELRYQHAADLRIDLERLTRSTVAGPAAQRRWLPAAAAATVVVAVIAGWIYRPRAATLTDTDTIILGEFTNTTGDAVFDETLRQGLAVQLQQSPFLRLISTERVRRTLLLMNQSADARLTPQLALGVCVRTASAAVLEGSIAMLGSQYVLGLRATSCTSGDILANEQAQAAKKEDVLGTLSVIATQFRTRVGESLATIEEHSMPLEEATTTSLDALKAYSAGMAVNGSRRIPLLQRAIELDPEFAMAHAHLGFRFSAVGESALARQSLLRAYELRHRASNVERYYIDTLYHRDVTGNMERELQTLEAWAQDYPRDDNATNLPAGLALSSTGQHERAIAQTDKTIALDPDSPNAYSSRARNQLLANRPDDALLTVQRATERNIDNSELVLIPYLVAFLKGDADAITRTGTEAKKNSDLQDFMPHLEALALARSGRLQDARRISAVPVEIAQQSGRRERAGMFEAARAVWEAFYGNATAARQGAGRALALGKFRDVDYAAAFALALSGDVPQSRALAENLARKFPEDTSVQFMYLPVLRALSSLSNGDSAAAIQALQISSRYDLALGRLGFVGRFGGLYPIYVRGLAYLAARQPADAAAEFQRIIDHPYITLVDPMTALARLQLARALAQSGDTVKAKSAYNDLLTLWKNADADLALLRDARAELARLP
ncbi:MAG: protein kinase [Acidobacteria bacterium]|nr:protein kinase [Acidobacteriota bacterium]